MRRCTSVGELDLPLSVYTLKLNGLVCCCYFLAVGQSLAFGRENHAILPPPLLLNLEGTFCRQRLAMSGKRHVRSRPAIETADREGLHCIRYSSCAARNTTCGTQDPKHGEHSDKHCPLIMLERAYSIRSSK
jgi:hypothetical protein